MAVVQGNSGRLSAKRALLAAVAGIAVLLAIAAIAPSLITARVAAKLRGEAARRDWRISWGDLRYAPPAAFRLRDLSVLAAGGDTLCSLRSLDLTADPWAALTLHARPRSVALAHARLFLRPHVSAEADTLAPDEEELSSPRRRGHADRSGRVRSQASELMRVLLLPARDLPRLRLDDVSIATAGDEASSITLDRLSLEPDRSGVRLRARGALESGQRIPFDLDLSYDDRDHLSGAARFDIADANGRREPLRLELSGLVHQDRRRGVVVIGDSTSIHVGLLPFRIGGRLERAGPRFALRLESADLTPDAIRASIPRPLLGPLTDVGVRGSFGYRAAFDLDLAMPDSVRLDADVIPHGLELDPRSNRLPLGSLAAPFTAEVHLPHDRIVAVDLFDQNPTFMPLDRMDTLLIGAVVTNEDGGFFRHRGFNTEAVRKSIAENIHAAAFRRGAGTITMQLARNLYLGHARTLSR
ncbi:MAG TPA: transglycosylase domain-containing protein, partial [Candidatus Udaeobacter sp.]|nr:transglycosylase domain-containing protein [Candidatus Udaeobacter sp.]